MKNLLHCHTKNVHSFPLSFENGLYRRIFYADYNHFLWNPIEVAIHPHHVDIAITILDGELYNPMYRVSKIGEVFRKFQWDNYIMNGVGGFTYLGEEKLRLISNTKYVAGESFTMKACELHTVQIDKGEKCVWLVEENKPSCEYFPLNYSPNDLTKWTSDGLYIEVEEKIKMEYIGQYLPMINRPHF